MSTNNNRLYEAYSQKKKNPLTPYMEAGTGSTSGSTMGATAQPTGAATKLSRAYAAPAAASNGQGAAQAAGQTALSRAYSRATTPTAGAAYTSGGQQAQPGVVLRQTAAENSDAAADTGAKTQGQTTLQRAYGSQNNGAYSAQRQNALNRAAASYNKLLNYLPEYNQLMGLGGLGVSEQALLNAQSDYAQSVADINAGYDELEQAYRDTQISNAANVQAELAAYINGAGDKFTQEGYDRFKQGLLDAGYTAQEIAAGEGLLQQSDLEIMQNASQGGGPLSDDLKALYQITGDGVLASQAKEADFGEFVDTGKVGSKQYQLVQDILTAARNGKIPNGAYVCFNYGSGAGGTEMYMYYNGYFYPTSYTPRNLSAKKDVVKIGRASSFGFTDPNKL